MSFPASRLPYCVKKFAYTAVSSCVVPVIIFSSTFPSPEYIFLSFSRTQCSNAKFHLLLLPSMIYFWFHWIIFFSPLNLIVSWSNSSWMVQWRFRMFAFRMLHVLPLLHKDILHRFDSPCFASSSFKQRSPPERKLTRHSDLPPHLSSRSNTWEPFLAACLFSLSLTLSFVKRKTDTTWARPRARSLAHSLTSNKETISITRTEAGKHILKVLL